MTRESTIAEIDAQLEKPRSTHPERVARLECLLRQARVELATPCACGDRKVLAEVRAVAKRWPVRGSKGYFLALDLDLKGPDQIPVRVIILDEPQGE